MPKIKAYKGNGAIIPIDAAKISSAFRCPWTKKIFGDKKSYVRHLKILRETRMHGRIRGLVRKRKFEDLWNQPSFESIISWIERNPEFMFDNGFRTGWHEERIKKYRDQFWIKITYLSLVWGANVSNSHSCPRNGTTNWSGRDLFKDGTPKPTGYPGFHGRIEYQLSHDIGFGSDVMRNLGIHTGTGGGITTNRFGYDVRFFDSDWPGLEKSRVFEILSDKHGWRTFKHGTPEYFK
jgi:uncharacterized C2H2 Zn-finger protein